MNFKLDNYYKELSNKRKFRNYDIPDIFWSTYAFWIWKIIIVDENINTKWLVYTYLFLELENDVR